jgi:hypothetical protein
MKSCNGCKFVHLNKEVSLQFFHEKGACKKFPWLVSYCKKEKETDTNVYIQ